MAGLCLYDKWLNFCDFIKRKWHVWMLSSIRGLVCIKQITLRILLMLNLKGDSEHLVYKGSPVMCILFHWGGVLLIVCVVLNFCPASTPWLTAACMWTQCTLLFYTPPFEISFWNDALKALPEIQVGPDQQHNSSSYSKRKVNLLKWLPTCNMLNTVKTSQHHNID